MAARGSAPPVRPGERKTPARAARGDSALDSAPPPPDPSRAVPRLLFLVPTESLAIDQASNRLSLFNVLEQVNLPAFPALLPQVCITILWQKERDERSEDVFVQTIEIRDPDGTAICPPRQAQFSMPKKRHRLVSIISNIQIYRAGQHEIRLFCHPRDVERPTDEHLLATYPIEVSQVHPPAGPPSPPHHR